MGIQYAYACIKGYSNMEFNDKIVHRKC